jgi:hypothetical protein
MRMRDSHLPWRSPVYAASAMATTTMPQATLNAVEVLTAGGNLLDAAIAARGDRSGGDRRLGDAARSTQAQTADS